MEAVAKRTRSGVLKTQTLQASTQTTESKAKEAGLKKPAKATAAKTKVSKSLPPKQTASVSKKPLLKDQPAATKPTGAAKTSAAKKPSNNNREPLCGMCGRDNKRALNDTDFFLTITECCGRWICDDEHTYCDRYYERRSGRSSYFTCMRSHTRYSPCFFHFNEGHAGDNWKKCKECLEESQFNLKGENEGDMRKNQPKAQFDCKICGQQYSSMDKMHSKGIENKEMVYFCTQNSCITAFKAKYPDELDEDEENVPPPSAKKRKI